MAGESGTLSRRFRIAIVVTGLLGIASFGCLGAYYQALLGIWHESGSLDFWAGEGVAAFEWRWLATLYGPMLLFHAAFFAAGFCWRSAWGRRD